MTNSERVLVYLGGIAPKSATNADIRSATGIKPHQQVFQITSHLVTKGKISGRKFGQEWQFWIEVPNVPVSQDIAQDERNA